jgi:hypothetical protein
VVTSPGNIVDAPKLCHIMFLCVQELAFLEPSVDKVMHVQTFVKNTDNPNF